MTYGTYGEERPGAPQAGPQAGQQPINPYTNQPGGAYGPTPQVPAGFAGTQPGTQVPQQAASPLGFDPNAAVGQLYGVQLTPRRILLILAVLCFAIAFLGGIGGLNLIALGFAFGFASFLFN